MATQESTLRVGVDSRPMVDGARRGEKALDDLGRKAGKTQEVFGRLNDKTMLLKRAFQGLIALGVAKFFRDITAASSSFETKMAEISTLVDTAVFNIGKLEEGLKRSAREFGAQPVDQAAAAYQIISAGAGSAADAIALLDASNRLAVGGVTDVATAADGLTSILNAYGMSATEAANVSDALFVGMRAGKTTIGELSASLGKVAPLASQAGVSVDEMVAATAALTKGGISTRESVTGLRAILAAVVKPTKEAADTAAALGLDFNTAALQSKGLGGFLQDLAKKTGGSTDALAKLFGGVEALIPILALSGQAGIDFGNIMEDMAEKTGQTDLAFQKIADTFEFQAGRVRKSITTALIDLGDVILDFLTPAMKFLADNFEAITRFVKVAAAGFALALTPALVGLIPVVAGLTTGLIAMAAAWLLTPFGQIAALILVAAAALAYFGDVAVEVAGVNTTVWNAFIAGVSVAWDLMGEFAGIVQQGMSDALSITGEFFGKVFDWIGDYIGGWGDGVDSVTSLIKKGINIWIGIHVGLIRSLGAVVGSLGRIWDSVIGNIQNAVLTGVQGIVNTFVEGLALIGDAADALDPFTDIDRGGAIRGLKINLDDSRVAAENLGTVLSEVGSGVATTFGEALNTDYVGAISDAVETLAGPILERYKAKLIEIEGESALTEEASAALATTITEVVTPALGGPNGLAGGADKATKALEELNRKRAEFIEGLDDEFNRIRENNGGAVELVREWYQEQLRLIDELGLKYEDYAMKLETVFQDRLAAAYQKDLENATDWRSGIERAIGGMSGGIESEADLAESALTGIFNGAQSALSEFVKTGTLDFKKFAQSVASDILMMVTKFLILKAVKSALGFGMKDGGMVGGSSGSFGLPDSFANGGPVTGPGGPRTDSIPAMLSNGEFVVNADATKNFLPLLEAINAGDNMGFAEGGLLNASGSLPTPSSGEHSNPDANTDATAAPAAAPNLKVVNVIQPSDIIDTFDSDDGERMVINILERNRSTVQGMLS